MALLEREVERLRRELAYALARHDYLLARCERLEAERDDFHERPTELEGRG